MKDSRPVTLAWSGKKSRIGDHPAVAKARAVVPHASFPQGHVYRGDNLEVLSGLATTQPETVTLAYLDPPFLTGRLHAKIVKGETLDSRTHRVAFDDRWSDRAEYLEALGERITEARKLLAPHGSIVVHVDPKTSHYVKVMMDEIFGEDCFASEIVWRYRRWPSKTQNFQRVHDVLLRYRKDAEAAPRWNTLYEPLAASTLATWGTNKQRAVVSDTGRRARSSTTEEKSRGVPLGDVWDIGVIAPVAKERTGYPTQKPEALLTRIVEALTSPGDVVLDPYSGSGTTLAVAARMGRSFIGIDQSDQAIETLTQRLEADQRPTYARAKSRR